MQGCIRALPKQEKDSAWQRKGKKYKAKYFSALKELCKKQNEEIQYDKDCQIQSSSCNEK